MQVLATLRAELFRSLLLQKIEFFDVHSASKLTNLISTELDSVRSFIFRNVSRDRGPRAILEVTVSFALSSESFGNFLWGSVDMLDEAWQQEVVSSVVKATAGTEHSTMQLMHCFYMDSKGVPDEISMSACRSEAA